MPQAPIDFNQYIGIQRMGARCLSLPRDTTTRYNQVWQGRAVALAAALQQHCGWKVAPPKACKSGHGFCTDLTFLGLPAWVSACGEAVTPYTCQRSHFAIGLANSSLHVIKGMGLRWWGWRIPPFGVGLRSMTLPMDITLLKSGRQEWHCTSRHARLQAVYELECLGVYSAALSFPSLALWHYSSTVHEPVCLAR